MAGGIKAVRLYLTGQGEKVSHSLIGKTHMSSLCSATHPGATQGSLMHCHLTPYANK